MDPEHLRASWRPLVPKAVVENVEPTFGGSRHEDEVQYRILLHAAEVGRRLVEDGVRYVVGFFSPRVFRTILKVVVGPGGLLRRDHCCFKLMLMLLASAKRLFFLLLSK
jgi:hypothetical protein